MNEWQPIDTAPKDGTMVLLYQFKPRRQGVGSAWHMSVGYCHQRTDGSDLWVAGVPFRPTHWMPLPDPPADRPAAAQREP